MKSLDFDWQIDEFMIYCRSIQLREKTMQSYEQTLRLFERWANEEMNLLTVDKVTEQVIRRYKQIKKGLPFGRSFLLFILPGSSLF